MAELSLDSQARATDLLSGDWTPADVIAFHTREKLLLRAHNEVVYRQLGRLVAEVSTLPRSEFSERYLQLFGEAMNTSPTVGSHRNVLEHMVGFLRRSGDDVGREKMLRTIEEFGTGRVPLSAALDLMASLVTRHNHSVYAEASYLGGATPRSVG